MPTTGEFVTDERDDLPDHLEMIQGVIERHARNSFLLKGWSLTLVAAVFLLAVRGEEPRLAMAVGLLPALVFWGLDAYYLRHERAFRALFNHVRTTPSGDRFNMDARPFRASVPSWRRTLCTTSVFWFHAVITFLVVGALALFTLRSGHGSQGLL